MTISYLKLKYCGYAYTLFEKRLKENQFVAESKEPTARLKSGNPEISPGGVQNEKIENP